ncbi:FKBP-type peptidyl-prolyl cis-trans isomerase [Sphingomicrobium nitratireducens]|uniref:FKBP-type peptidyl-prolyl cis-trans isomerase n=1 Tax=Sphingomicrobium nitratireducens TaxID=2964666 RepID=UPI002240491C|nr:FKBP-type peptidyl-prolyl cis-trans isomerase [Sphingomicrobium nitratireducens]
MSVSQVPLRPIAKGSVLKLWLAIAALVLAGVAIAWCATSPLKGETTASGLKIRTMVEGTGDPIRITDGAFVSYEGRLLDGTTFDSSGGRAVPMLPSQVVPGFSEALQLMREGGSYRVIIPSELAYGDSPPPGAPIPPGADLEFDVSIESIVRDAALMLGQQQGAPAPQAPPAE